MTQGMIFDINEFAVHDGPGIRTSVFLKGCPLKCQWCHNPEGQSFGQELLRGSNGCLHCGACTAVCPSPEHCILCGACIKVCPQNLRRFAGRSIDSQTLADMLLKNRELLMQLGGVTFTGGEPLSQSEFLFDVMRRIKPIHIAIETSGYASQETYQELLSLVDLVLMDIKHTDSAVHKTYTGVPNEPILANLELLKASSKPFIIRIPVIPQVNDSVENMQRTAELLDGAAQLQRVELLPYHKTAGAKYELLGKDYPFSYTRETPSFAPLIQAFESHKIPVFVP